MTEARALPPTSSADKALPASQGGDGPRWRRNSSRRSDWRLGTIITRRRLMAGLALTVLIVTSAGDSALPNAFYVNLHVLRGDRAFAVQDYGKAEAEYHNVLRLSPGDPVAV